MYGSGAKEQKGSKGNIESVPTKTILTEHTNIIKTKDNRFLIYHYNTYNHGLN
jgi:hypothetical protein